MNRDIVRLTSIAAVLILALIGLALTNDITSLFR